MSKKKPGNSKKQPSRTISAAPKPIKALKPKVSMERAPIVSSADGLLQKIFWGLAGVFLIATIILSLGSGINADDEYQNDYSEKLVAYYTTMGKDTSALNIPKGNMHLYGGFFDLVTGFANKALGFDTYDRAYHQVRHVFNAVLGVLTMLFVGLTAREIAGWRAGILALVLLFLSPRFLGHSLMNPKDIPFAAGFAIANYYIILLLKTLPKPEWGTLIGLALGLALALATRAGGLLLFGYLGLFLGLDFLFKHGLKGLSTHSNLVGRYAMYGIGVAVVGYILAILTWPWALQSPIANPLKALSEFSALGVKIRVLFEGENVMSDKTIWYYPVLWMIKTIPLFVLIGFAGSFVLFRSLWKKYAPIPVLLMLFASIFPVLYIIYKDSTLHDGWRHLLFVYPSMVVMATLCWMVIESLFSKNKIGRYIVYAVLGLLLLETSVFIGKNPHYPYVYFNPIGGGIKGAYGYYETDYWGVSTKQAVDWMEKQGLISANMQDTVVIGTSFWYPVSRLAGKYKGKVQVKYVRFNNRYAEQWDYGIFPSRYIRGPHLRNKTWPNSRAIVAIKANGVPLTAIEKDEDHFVFRGEQAIKAQNWQQAITELQQETAKHPNNELAWQDLSSAYINSGNFQEAIKAASQSLQAAPQNETALYFLGLSYLNIGNVNEAINTFQQCIKVNEENAVVYYYLGVAYQQLQNWQAVLTNANEAIKLNQRFKQAYELAATALEQQGDVQSAQRYREAASQF